MNRYFPTWFLITLSVCTLSCNKKTASTNTPKISAVQVKAASRVERKVGALTITKRPTNTQFLSILPADTAFFFGVTSLTRAAEVINFTTLQKAAGDEMTKVRAMIVRRLAFDPAIIKDYAKVGVDIAQPAGMAFLRLDRLVFGAYFGVLDQRRVVDTLKRVENSLKEQAVSNGTILLKNHRLRILVTKKMALVLEPESRRDTDVADSIAQGIIKNGLAGSLAKSKAFKSSQMTVDSDAFFFTNAKVLSRDLGNFVDAKSKALANLKDTERWRKMRVKMEIGIAKAGVRMLRGIRVGFVNASVNGGGLNLKAVITHSPNALVGNTLKSSSKLYLARALKTVPHLGIRVNLNVPGLWSGLEHVLLATGDKRSFDRILQQASTFIGKDIKTTLMKLIDGHAELYLNVDHASFLTRSPRFPDIHAFVKLTGIKPHLTLLSKFGAGKLTSRQSNSVTVYAVPMPLGATAEFALFREGIVFSTSKSVIDTVLRGTLGPAFLGKQNPTKMHLFRANANAIGFDFAPLAWALIMKRPIGNWQQKLAATKIVKLRAQGANTMKLKQYEMLTKKLGRSRATRRKANNAGFLQILNALGWAAMSINRQPGTIGAQARWKSTQPAMNKLIAVLVKATVDNNKRSRLYWTSRMKLQQERHKLMRDIKAQLRKDLMLKHRDRSLQKTNP